MLSMLMFATLVGVMQSELLADNGKVTVTQVTYSASTNVADYFFVELYYEYTEMYMENGMMKFRVVRDESHQEPSSVGTLQVGGMTCYVHLRDHNDLVVGRTYKWKVWPTTPGPNGTRVPDVSNGTFSSGQTTAIAP